MKRHRYCLFFSVFLLSFSAFAQDFKSDYKQVHEAYNKLEKFSCELKIDVFEDQRSKTPSQKMSSVIKKSANDYWYSMDKIKMVVNDGCILYINEENRQMIYTIRNSKNEMVIPNQNAVATIDTILKKSDSVVYSGVRDNCKKYIIYSGKGEIVRSEMLISRESSLITKIVYYYKAEKDGNASKVEINYVKMNTAPQFADNEFSEKQYMSYSKNKVKPLGKYIGYETSVINQNDIK